LFPTDSAPGEKALGDADSREHEKRTCAETEQTREPIKPIGDVAQFKLDRTRRNLHKHIAVTCTRDVRLLTVDSRAPARIPRLADDSRSAIALDGRRDSPRPNFALSYRSALPGRDDRTRIFHYVDVVDSVKGQFEC